MAVNEIVTYAPTMSANSIAGRFISASVFAIYGQDCRRRSPAHQADSLPNANECAKDGGTRACASGQHGPVASEWCRDLYPPPAGYARDQRLRGRVIDFRIPVVCGGVTINPGDVIFGDLDGIAIVPQTVEDEIFALALEKVEKNRLQKSLREEGISAQAAFSKYGVQ